MFIDERARSCDRKAVSLNGTKIWNQIEIPIWTIEVRRWIVQIGISNWFRIFVPFNETAFRSQKRARSSVNTAGQGSFRQKLFTFPRCSMPLKDCSIFNSSFTVTLNPLGRENSLRFSHCKTILSNVCVCLERVSQRLRIRNCLLNFLESNSR